MINIFVIDDHPVIIDGLKSLFTDGEDKIKITGSANSAKEALSKLKRSSAKIVLLDLVMPETSGVEFCLVIKNMFPEKKVIALTGSLNSTMLYNTWNNKADAILMKYCGKEELVNTIYRVLEGSRIVGSRVPEFRDAKQKRNGNVPKLTSSEQKILNLLAKGKTREEAGKILGSSYHAVSFHCKNLFKKFNENKLVSVLDRARRAQLIN